MSNPNFTPYGENDRPFAHQEWLMSHLAKVTISQYTEPSSPIEDNLKIALLATPEGKPVMVSQVSSKHGIRISVTRGSYDEGDLDKDRTVYIRQIEGHDLTHLHPVETAADAQSIIKDLLTATNSTNYYNNL